MMRSERNAVLVSTDTVGERIKKARVARNITQTELSKRIGTVYQRIHEWEAAWKNPSDKYLDKMAEALNVDSEWLKSGVLSKEPYCVYKQFYSTDDDCITEEQFEKYKNSLAKTTDYLVNVNSETLGKITVVIENISAEDILNQKEKQEKRLNEYLGKFQDY